MVAHSVGGLLVRVLIEHPGGDIAPGWAARVDDLVMVATPNHGSWVGSVVAGVGHSGEWDGFAADLRPGSPFLDGLGPAEPAGEVYTAVGGNPWPLR